jgi:hypothetical protein
MNKFYEGPSAIRRGLFVLFFNIPVTLSPDYIPFVL